MQPVTQVTTLGGYYNWPTEETFYCGTSQCHTTLPEVARYRPDGTDLCYNCNPVSKSGHGDLTQKHTSGFVANPAMDCSSCHKGVLTDEHLSRVDAQGNPYTCATCHNSARAEVQQAIASNQTNCDACHTVHADLTVPHLKGIFPDPNVDCVACHEDVAQEMSPARASYHAVLGPSKALSGTYVNGWSRTSRMKCTDCHGSNGISPTSAYPGILKRYYDENSSSADSGMLCFMCHDRRVYGGGGKGTTRFSKHNEGEHKVGGGLVCLMCHAASPHGSDRPALMVIRGDAAAGSRAALIAFTYSPQGRYGEKSCVSPLAACHEHAPR
ncbi:MAG: hypothetical protein D9V47_09565 [Clostridia bacterium]|nr:MAG: hypothetical protein D9V47_09565 [Clostridia bacterium]